MNPIVVAPTHAATHRPRRHSWPFAPLLLLATSGCYTTYRAPEVVMSSDNHTVVFPSDTPECVEVHLRHGHVLIQHGDELGGDVKIEVQGRDGAEAQARLASVRLTPTEENGVCVLRVTQGSGVPIDGVDIRYRLRVPPHIVVRVRTQSGQVAIRGFRGDTDIVTESGAIHARPGDGVHRLVTTLGPIRLEGGYAGADLSSLRGGIEVTLPGTAATPAVRLVATSRLGPVSFDMPENSVMLLDFATKNGDLRTDFPVKWEKIEEFAAAGRSFRGVVGEPGQPPTVSAEVRCDSAIFEVRRLLDAARPAASH